MGPGSLGGVKSFHVYDFGPNQSEAYAKAIRDLEGLHKLGDPNMVHLNAWVDNVVGEIPELRKSYHLYVPSPLPWVQFKQPPNWIVQRRGLFTSVLIRSMGTERDVEIASANIDSTETSTLSQNRQKEAIQSFFEQAEELGAQISLIHGNMGRFLGA
jgi:hypothetical protein